jgi:hypothetical protein
MAFNDVGSYWMRQGESFWISLHRRRSGIGADFGAQWIMADPKIYNISHNPPNGSFCLEVTRHRKQVDAYNGGAEWFYSCLVENVGESTFVSFQGGGNV